MAEVIRDDGRDTYVVEGHHHDHGDAYHSNIGLIVGLIIVGLLLVFLLVGNPFRARTPSRNGGAPSETNVNVQTPNPSSSPSPTPKAY